MQDVIRVKAVEDSKLDETLRELDFSTTSLSIGVARKDGKEEWLALDKDDLQILKYLLLKSHPVRGYDPEKREETVVAWTEPAVEVSKPLSQLAKWVDGALRWMRSNE